MSAADGHPRVSLCIPAYGRPDTLGTAVQSVLVQDFDDFELVVSDDSGDLEPVVGQFDDSRIRYFRNETRLGMAGNWTAALDRARAELKGLLMDDDRLLPGFVRSVVSAFDSDPSLGLVFTDHYFDYGGELRRRHCTLPGGRYESFLQPLVEHMPVAVSACLMRREVWEEMRPLPDLLTADVYMHTQAALHGWPFYYLDEPLMAYRVHGGQLSRHAERFRNDRVKVWELFRFDDDAPCEELRKSRLGRALVSRAAWRLRTGSYEDAKRDAERARSLGVARASLRVRATVFLAEHSLIPRLVASVWQKPRPSVD
jgi:glycosyltransferase involved in cell wall biosynthesis